MYKIQLNRGRRQRREDEEKMMTNENEANERLVSTEDGECGGSFHKKSVRFTVKLK